MIPQIVSSRQLAQYHGVKGLIYGDSGVGKTSLAILAPYPLLISAESGLLSLGRFDVPTWKITALSELIDVYNFAKSSAEANHFQTIMVDSVSEVGEIVLADRMSKNKDPRQAYQQTNDMVLAILKDFRDLPGKHIWFLAKMSNMEINPGERKFHPMMPGQKLTPNMPYLFDEVFFMGAKPPTADGKSERFLLTQPDWNHVAKDRSGTLAPQEKPDLGAITKKIQGVV